MSRRLRLRQHRGAFIFGAAIGLLLLAVGGFMVLLQAPKQEREWRHIQAYQELNKARYGALPTGEQVVLTGQLQDNATLNRYELVAYRVEEWVVSTDDDGDETGSWRTLEVDVPALALTVPGGVIKTAAVRSLSLSGQTHQFIRPSSSYETAQYENRLLPDGSIRIQGFRNRDLVTVVGRKISDGGLQPERLHAGDRASLVDLLRGNVLALRIIGGVFMAVGAVVLGVMGWLTWRQQRT